MARIKMFYVYMGQIWAESIDVAFTMRGAAFALTGETKHLRAATIHMPAKPTSGILVRIASGVRFLKCRQTDIPIKNVR